MLRQERKRRKWKLSYVADKVGVTASTIHDMETGRCKPSFDVLVKLLDLFDYDDPRKLFGAATPDKTIEKVAPRGTAAGGELNTVKSESKGIQTKNYAMVIAFNSAIDFQIALDANPNMRAIMGANDYDREHFPGVYLVGLLPTSDHRINSR